MTLITICNGSIYLLPTPFCSVVIHFTFTYTKMSMIYFYKFCLNQSIIGINVLNQYTKIRELIYFYIFPHQYFLFPLADPRFYLVSSLQPNEFYFSILCNTGLLEMNYLSFIYLFFLDEHVYFFLFFKNIIPLTWGLYFTDEKSAIILITVLLYVMFLP